MGTLTKKIELIEQGRVALEKARTVEEKVALRGQFASIGHYLRQQKGCEVAALEAAELKVITERQLGELLAANGERRGGKSNCHDASSIRGGTSKPLPDGVSHTQSSRWQKIAGIRKRSFDDYLKAARAKGELTTSGVLRIANEQRRQAKRQANEQLIQESVPADKVEGPFPAIVIDPPWDWSDEGDVDQFGRATPTYGTMTIEQVTALPVATLADKNAHIYLWITNRSLPKGFALLDAWGFRYVTALTWCKPSIGMGNYFRGSTEHVLFGVRGSMPLLRSDVGTWFQAARPGKHSSKPDEFYSLVESCSQGPWLEMFAREPRKGWVSWGAEA